MLTNIYINLEDTLLCSSDPESHSWIPRKGIPLKVQYPTLDPLNPTYAEEYLIDARPHALEILTHLRNIAPTKLLTETIRNYALAVNTAINLNFHPADIIAREDWLTPGNYEPVSKNLDPSSFLIEHKPGPIWEEEQSFEWEKRTYLGLRKKSVFKIRKFTGQDPETFSQEIKALIAKITQTAQ